MSINEDRSLGTEMTWTQICTAVDRILKEDRPRVRRFPWAEGIERRPPEVTILPHGARRIKRHWGLEEKR